MELPDFDEEAFAAATNLVGRTGARQLSFGYLREGVPVHLARWWANAHYKGARITVEDEAGPVEAVEALARRLLTGAQCAHCKRLVALSDGAAFAYTNATLLDGRAWGAAQAAKAGQCRWRRVGRRWMGECKGSRKS
jgi:hypothetical protein